MSFPNRWAILGVLILSESVVELDATIVNVALPDMARQLDASTSSLQWIVDAYMLLFGGLLLVAGALGDRIGRRPVLLAGIATFGSASVLAGVAPTVGWLIAGRAAMGLGAAMILPTTLAILSDVFSGEERLKAFSLWSATAGLSFAVGPTVGGALVEWFGWPAIFAINVPIAIAAAALCLRIVPALRPVSAAPPDAIGGLLSVAALGTLLYAIIRAPHAGWGSTRTIALLAVAAVLGLALLGWEHRRRFPMVDLGLFRSRAFSASSIAIGLQFLATSGALFVLTQYLQGVLGHSPLGAGVRLAPVAIALMVAALSAPAVDQRLGTKLTVALGLGFSCAGLAVGAGLSPGTGYGRVAISLVLAGFGGGLAITPAVTAMLSVVSRQQTGSSAALNNAAVLVGSALGVAVLGALLATEYANELAAALPFLPDSVLSQAQSSVITATQATQGSGGPAIAAVAKSSFTAAAADTFLVGSIICGLGAMIALILMPTRVTEAAESALVDEPSAAPALAALDGEEVG